MERSYKGIQLAQLIRGLYFGTWARGPGRLHDRPGLTVTDVEQFLARAIKKPHRLRPAPQTRLAVDMLYGRPMRLDIDLVHETFDDVAYNAEAGYNRAAIVLRKIMPVVNIMVTEHGGLYHVTDDGGECKEVHVSAFEDAQQSVQEREDFYYAIICRRTVATWPDGVVTTRQAQ